MHAPYREKHHANVPTRIQPTAERGLCDSQHKQQAGDPLPTSSFPCRRKGFTPTSVRFQACGSCLAPRRMQQCAWEIPGGAGWRGSLHLDGLWGLGVDSGCRTEVSVSPGVSGYSIRCRGKLRCERHEMIVYDQIKLVRIHEQFVPCEDGCVEHSLCVSFC